MEIKANVYLNLHLTDGLGMKFTACLGELVPDGALTSFTVCDAFATSRVRHNYLRHKVCHAQNI